MPHSNLESFLSSTTPRVPRQILPKTCNENFISHWQALEKDGIDYIEYFSLKDLWECYDEWSAYGVGAPIFNDGGNFVQYYTPYISAIQIFMANEVSSSEARVDCDGEYEDKSWSCESDGEKLSRSSSNNSDKTWDVEDLGDGFEGYWHGRERLGELYFEYFESDVPFGRVPLKEKINALSRRYPGLKTFNSIDLSPASWMAVAWYPIYHIPCVRQAKELYASFLTYHTLSSLFQDDVSGCQGNEAYYYGAGGNKSESEVRCNGISLHPFGLASYRMQPKVWLNPETLDQERFSTLSSAANSWLKQLQVQHHDYNFFVSHPM